MCLIIDEISDSFISCPLCLLISFCLGKEEKGGGGCYSNCIAVLILDLNLLVLNLKEEDVDIIVQHIIGVIKAVLCTR